MKIVLSKPPSINNIYKYSSKGGYARSYISPEGKVWFEESAYKLKSQYKSRKPIESECELWIELYTNRYSTQDCDNIVKPIQDALQKNNIVKNDSLFYRVTTEKFPCKKEEERVELEIKGY